VTGFTVVVPVRDRHGSALKNCFRSIELQTLQPLEVIVVDYGSTPENSTRLKKISDTHGFRFIRYITDDVWSLAAARNIGLRRAKTKYAVVFDADLIMESRVLETLRMIHEADSNTYVSTQVVLLDVDAIDVDDIELPRDYEKLMYAKSSYRSEGWGGIDSAGRDWWRASQGFDERMTWWGWEDVDMWKRAGRAGLKRVRLGDLNMPETQVYHQWHPNVLIMAPECSDYGTPPRKREGDETHRHERAADEANSDDKA